MQFFNLLICTLPCLCRRFPRLFPCSPVPEGASSLHYYIFVKFYTSRRSSTESGDFWSRGCSAFSLESSLYATFDPAWNEWNTVVASCAKDINLTKN